MSCCPPNSWPYMQAPSDYSPKGSVVELANNLPVYVVGDCTAGTHAVIVFPEVFCWEGRLKGICDHFASKGYYVIMPDIMRGDSMSLPQNSGDGKDAFLSKWATWSNIETDCQTLLAHLTEKGVTSVGAAGFCWGAWVIFRASAINALPLKAGACCHPSVRLEGFSGGNEESLASQVNCPMMLASARNDPENVQEGGAVAQILTSKFATSQIKSYSEVDHGWVSRGDISEEVVARNVQAALEQCDSFFAMHLK